MWNIPRKKQVNKEIMNRYEEKKNTFIRIQGIEIG